MGRDGVREGEERERGGRRYRGKQERDRDGERDWVRESYVMYN